MTCCPTREGVPGGKRVGTAPPERLASAPVRRQRCAAHRRTPPNALAQRKGVRRWARQRDEDVIPSRLSIANWIEWREAWPLRPLERLKRLRPNPAPETRKPLHSSRIVRRYPRSGEPW